MARPSGGKNSGKNGSQQTGTEETVPPRRLPVTALVGCPYAVVNKQWKPELKYAFEAGAERHDEIQEILRRDGFETEVPVEYEYKGYTIAGKIDALHREKRLVAEIKSARVRLKYFFQLLAYRDILYAKEGVLYKPVLILYKPGSYTIVNSFLYLPPPGAVLDYMKRVIDVIEMLGRLPRVAGDDCKSCALAGSCRPEYRVSKSLRLLRLNA